MLSSIIRPCDNCSIRKIRCDKRVPCSGCTMYNLICTTKREIRKTGPKGKDHYVIAPLSSEGSNLKSPNVYFQPQITLAEFLPFLNLYQTWYYEIWPVISINQLTYSISSKKDSNRLELNPGNIQSYILCCALAGTIKELVPLASHYDEKSIPNNFETVDFIGECLRARNCINYRLTPSIDTVLASFFLYIYYADTKRRYAQAFIYFREAITITDILEICDESKYEYLSRKEIYRLRNIYNILLVTERFISLTTSLPPVLEIPKLSTSIIEGSCHEISGFSEIVKLFVALEKAFSTNLFKEYSLNKARIPKQLVQEIQVKLDSVDIQNNIPDSQKLNIILTQNWMKLLIWNIGETNSSTSLASFEKEFPIIVARDLLKRTEGFPKYAFETNGPGACRKLVEIAEMIGLVVNKDNLSIGYDTLMSVLNIILLLKTKQVSNNIDNRIKIILQNDIFMTGFNSSQLFSYLGTIEPNTSLNQSVVVKSEKNGNAKSRVELENPPNNQQPPFSPGFLNFDLLELQNGLPERCAEFNDDPTSVYGDNYGADIDYDFGEDILNHSQSPSTT